MRFPDNKIGVALFLAAAAGNNDVSAVTASSSYTIKQSNAIPSSSSFINNIDKENIGFRRGRQRQRKLNYELLAGYEPRTLVTNQAAIDLDQAEMEYQLSHHHLDIFRHVYEQGGHSLSVARLTLLGGDADSIKDAEDEDLTTLPLPSPPAYEIPKNTEVIGWTKDGDIVTGRLREALVPWDKDDANITILVEYNSNIDQTSYLGCQMGGLVHTDTMNEDGCKFDVFIMMPCL